MGTTTTPEEEAPVEPCGQQTSVTSALSPQRLTGADAEEQLSEQSVEEHINQKVPWNPSEIVLEQPDDVTVHVLNQLFQQRHEPGFQKLPSVKAVQFLGKISAILSQVLELVVEFEPIVVDDNHEPTPSSELWLPTHFVVKFFKPSISMTKDMFRVEGNFYQHMTTICNGHPFCIPRALYCSPTCIILEKVPDIITYNLLESCPTDRLCQVIDHLAQFHAYHWKDNSTASSSTSSSYTWPFPDLSLTAGMGASLPGPDKARYFMENYSEFCQHLLDQQPLDIQKESLEAFGKQFDESSKVLDIHESVYSFTPTLIHGDFHVGNMLFSKLSVKNEEDDDDDNVPEKMPIWLLDWATCGQGNPLCDFVFFWVVSTKDADARTLMQQYLPLYYQTLMTCRRTHNHKTDAEEDDVPSDFSYSDCVQMVRTCLIHQFILLVCYDAWTRNFLLEICNQEGDKATLEFYERHFDNVNRRCAVAVLSDEVGVIEH